MNNKIYKNLSMMLITGSLISSSMPIYATSNLNSNISSNNKTIPNTKVSTDSGKLSDTIYGTKYTWFTRITTTSTNVKGTTWADASRKVPAGHIGAHCNLYSKSTGKVVRTANWNTNPISVSGYGNTTATYDAKGTYFVRGTTKFYNGNGYIVKGAKESPELSVRMENIRIPDEELKERQHLYETKNMIAAVGENNVEGYVSLDDLYDTDNQPKTPEEFLEIQRKNQRSKFKMVPLYSSDGETIIGEYRIDLNTETYMY